MHSLRAKIRSVQKKIIFHVPRHSSEECNVLIEYSKKYAAQWPHKDNEYLPGGGDKRGKSVRFDSSVKEANIMEHGDPIPKKKREKKLVKKRKSESAKVDPKDCENTYGIDHHKIGEASHYLDDSE